MNELARHPAAKQRVVEEVDRFGREREPQFGDLAQFPFIDAVLKEGMRLHPPVTPLIALVSHCIIESLPHSATASLRRCL